MAFASKRTIKSSGRQTRSIAGGPSLSGKPVSNFGIVGTGIIGGASTTRPIPAMGKPTSSTHTGHEGGTLTHRVPKG